MDCATPLSRPDVESTSAYVPESPLETSLHGRLGVAEDEPLTKSFPDDLPVAEVVQLSKSLPDDLPAEVLAASRGANANK